MCSSAVQERRSPFYSEMRPAVGANWSAQWIETWLTPLKNLRGGGFDKDSIITNSVFGLRLFPDHRRMASFQ